MMRLRTLILLGGLLLIGCSTTKPFDAKALDGKSYAEVVRSNHLDHYHSWPEMNAPPGEDPGVTYFLDGGNLTFKYSEDAGGKPAVVHDAAFWPSDQSAEQRFQNANASWSNYVAAHGGARPVK